VVKPVANKRKKEKKT